MLPNLFFSVIFLIVELCLLVGNVVYTGASVQTFEMNRCFHHQGSELIT